MRSFIAGLFLVAAASAATIPSCANSCFATAIAASGCGATDLLCQCTTGKTAITNSVTPCLLKGSCSSSDLESIQGITDAQCAAAEASASSAPASSSTAASSSASGSSAAAVASASSSVASSISSSSMAESSSAMSSSMAASSSMAGSTASKTSMAASTTASVEASTGAASLFSVDRVAAAAGVIAAFAL